MKRISILVPCMVAACAVGALTATSALGLPDFVPPAEFPVAIAGVNSGLLNPVILTGNSAVECTANTSAGEIVNAMEVQKLQAKYTGCKDGMFACTSAGQAAGTIVTKELMGYLTFLHKNPMAEGLEVGLAILAKTGNVLAEFTCAGVIKVTVAGEVVGALTPINKPVVAFTLTFNVLKPEGKDEQELTKYFLLVGEPAPLEMLTALTAFGENAFFMGQDILKTPVPVEIKA